MTISPPKTSFWQSVKHLLFEPNAAITDVGQRRQAQLLAWITLILAGWFLLAVTSIVAVGSAIQGAAILFIVVIAALVAYAFSRTRHVQVASWILTILFIASGYSMLMVLPLKDAGPTFLALVVLGFVIGSAVLTVQGLTLAVIVNTLCWIMVAAWLSAAARSDFFAPAASGTITGILLTIFSGVRNLIERDRLQAIAAANEELRAIQSTLEVRVTERTAIAEAARQEAETARKALEDEIWLANGQLAVNQALRGQQNLDDLSRAIIQAICDYLEAPVGVLFVWQDNLLKFAGGRAFTPSPERPLPRFALGEGLIGQVGRDQQPLILKHVPPGYLDVISALGDTPPHQIAVWPLRYDDQLAGVVEIGLARSLTASQEHYLQRVSETVAAALQTIQARARIDELLRETQVQTEELQSREEELRAINEELEAQAEALHTGGDFNGPR